MWRLSWALSAVLAFAAAVPSVAAEEAVSILKPGRHFGAPAGVELAAGEPRHFEVPLAEGQAALLTVTQAANTLELRWPAERAQAALRPASGRESALRILLLGERTGPLRFTIQPGDGAQGARFRIQLGPAHAATVSERRLAAAQSRFAAAEAQRRSGDKSATAAIRAALSDVRNTFDTDADGCNSRAAGLDLARLEYAAADYLAARAAAQAATQSRCAEDRADLAKAYHLVGVSNSTLGEFPAAIAAEEHALSLTRAIGDAPNEAIQLGNLGTMYRVVGANGKALAAARASLKLAQQLGDRERIAFVHDSLAGLHLVRGELAAALAAHRQTLDDLEGLNFPLVEGNARLNLGITLFRLGDHAEALDAWNAGEAVCRASEDARCLAHIDDSRGDLYLDEGRCDDAEAAYRRALSVANDKSLQREAADAQRGLGLCALQRGAFEAARQNLELALSGFHAIEAVEEVYARLSLGDLASREQQPEVARNHYEAALNLSRRQQAAGAEVLAQASLARIDFEAGAWLRARDEIRAAIALIESERARIDDPALRTSYFSGARSYYALLIEILMQLDRQAPGAGHAEAALLAAERARARTLTDQLAQRAVLSEAKIPAALRAEREVAEDRLHELGYALARLDDASTVAERTSLRRKIAEASRRLDSIRGRIRAADPRYASVIAPEPLSLSRLRREALDRDTTILEYWLGETHSYVWQLTQTGLKTAVLPPRAALEVEIEALRAQLASPAPLKPGMSLPELAQREEAARATTQSLATALAATLLPDAIRDETPRHRVIVADGLLQRLPFSVLDPAGASPDTSYLPSIQTLRALRAGHASMHHASQIAILADPVFAPDDPRLAQPAAREPVALHQSVGRAARAAGLSGLPRLQHSRAEAEGVAAMAPGSASLLKLDFSASRAAALATDWSAYRIVHFATHALLDAETPELSGIVLSLYDAQGRPLDGFLSVNDIYRLDMPAELVVLSACESADAASHGTEDRFNLARAFFYAGAQRVLASLWTVDDRASADFMQRFYHALIMDRRGPDEALRIAQKSMADDPRWSAPYYWAGYVLQGDWRRSTPEQPVQRKVHARASRGSMQQARAQP